MFLVTHRDVSLTNAREIGVHDDGVYTIYNMNINVGVILSVWGCMYYWMTISSIPCYVIRLKRLWGSKFHTFGRFAQFHAVILFLSSLLIIIVLFHSYFLTIFFIFHHGSYYYLYNVLIVKKCLSCPPAPSLINIK